MTTAYDPAHAAYVDEADVRGEMTRVFDVCGECRMCVSLCSTFPSLFDLLGGDAVPADAGRLTPEQQDRVVDQCYHCNLCSVSCPYTPARHSLDIDFPRLMLRAQAMRRANGHAASSFGADHVLVRPDMVGRVATTFSAGANRALSARAGSFTRRVIQHITGASSTRRIPPYAPQRFSSWLAASGPRRLGSPERRPVAVLPTCVVDYQLPGIGKDLVRVYERNGIACSTPSARCCGAPWLHAGHVKKFTKVASANVEALAKEIRNGRAVVVPEPTCGQVVRDEYPRYVRSPDAELVAANTFDASAYLVMVHLEGPALDTTFVEPVPTGMTVYGQHGADLLRLTGAPVRAVGGDIGDTAWWGVRSGHEVVAASNARRLAVALATGEPDAPVVLASDSAFASLAITEQTGETPLHPLQVLARAYGITPRT